MVLAGKFNISLWNKTEGKRGVDKANQIEDMPLRYRCGYLYFAFRLNLSTYTIVIVLLSSDIMSYQVHLSLNYFN